MKPEHVRGVDILMVRENASGLYQGKWTEARTTGGRVAEHCFSYSEAEVRRILRPAAAVANSRRGHLTVVYKEAGVPSISALWRDCALEISARAGVRCSLLDIDHIAYRLIQHPDDFDVVVAPNLFGDVLSDLGGVLLGSRGLCFAGSFAGNGDAVYSTNHGAAYDLAGSDRANPVAQILSLAMLLRESLHLEAEARLIEDAVDSVCREGWRTADLAEAGCPVIGTREMGERIAQAVASISGANGAQSCAPRMRVRSRTGNQAPQCNWDEAPNYAPVIRHEVSRMTPFLLLVDLQHDYLRAAGLVPAADQIVDRAALLLQGCRAANIPVAHVWTTVSRADDQRMPHWKRLGKWMCVDGTPGHAPPAPLRPETSEPIVHKRFFSAFSSSTLAPMLTGRGVDTLIVAGIHLQACVRQTVLAAYEKGFDIWVADDAVGSDDPLHAAITRRYLQSRAARFASVVELLAMFKNGPTQAPTTAPTPCSRSTKPM